MSSQADQVPLKDTYEPEEHKYDYDVVVIGGGSGGLAFSKRVAELGKKVAVCDFVKPSTQGTTWGLGGTCVNVGCIPKKLMHQASLLGEAIEDAKSYGWEVPEKVQHNWERMVQEVQDYIGSLNFGYRVNLREKKVEYLNALATFVDPHTLQTVNKQNKVAQITARRFVIAVGGRPRIPDFPGAKEYCITSDDVFSLQSPPGKTLVIGASYVALECAGFLAGVGFDTTVMVRSILLRGFDSQMAELIGSYMTEHGTKFIRPAVPTKVEKLPSGKLKVYYQMFDAADHQNVLEEASEEYDTVLLAIGRDADTRQLNLEAAGVNNITQTGHIKTARESTNVPHIYCIGDVQYNRPELTPVAILTGRLLAARLYGDGKEWMNYDNVATAVFTPLEYGAIGLSEETAVERFGADSIEVYHSYFKPLEFTLPHRPENECYLKLICNKADDERVVGLHILGPHAGEVTQGYALGFRLGATKRDFDMTVGIHPTVAEEFTVMHTTKRSGADPKKTGC